MTNNQKYKAIHSTSRAASMTLRPIRSVTLLMYLFNILGSYAR